MAKARGMRQSGTIDVSLLPVRIHSRTGTAHHRTAIRPASWERLRRHIVGNGHGWLQEEYARHQTLRRGISGFVPIRPRNGFVGEEDGACDLMNAPDERWRCDGRYYCISISGFTAEQDTMKESWWYAGHLTHHFTFIRRDLTYCYIVDMSSI